jgi:hypothetical protein
MAVVWCCRYRLKQLEGPSRNRERGKAVVKAAISAKVRIASVL